MARRLAVVLLVIVGFGAIVVAAGANGGVRATLTRTIPAGRSGGDHVIVAWKLRTASGHPVVVKRVTLRIVCPTGDSYTTTVAKPLANGTYRVTAIVPPGGIGTMSIRSGKQTFPITNPFHR